MAKLKPVASSPAQPAPETGSDGQAPGGQDAAPEQTADPATAPPDGTNSLMADQWADPAEVGLFGGVVERTGRPAPVVTPAPEVSGVAAGAGAVGARPVGDGLLVGSVARPEVVLQAPAAFSPLAVAPGLDGLGVLTTPLTTATPLPGSTIGAGPSIVDPGLGLGDGRVVFDPDPSILDQGLKEAAPEAILDRGFGEQFPPSVLDLPGGGPRVEGTAGAHRPAGPDQLEARRLNRSACGRRAPRSPPVR